MTSDQRFDRFERSVPLLLEELGMGPPPDYRDSIVGRTAAMRQRPAWTFPERWIPMETVSQRIPVAPIRWRPVALFLMLGLLIVAALAIGIGSQRHLPAPFGPARNGLIAYHENGDIFLGDPANGTSRAVVGGPDIDEWPMFSRDGTRVAFLRRALAAGASNVVITNADGSGLRQLTRQPLQDVSGADWSADGRLILIDYSAGDHAAIGIIDVEHGGLTPLDVGMDGFGAVFRPTDDRTIAFTADEDSKSAIYVVDRTGRPPRRIAWGGGPAYSPDGSRIAYGRTYQPEVERNETRVVNADGSDERLVGDRPDIQYQGTPVWSPDGTQLAVFRNSRTAGLVLAVIPADGSGPGREFAAGFRHGFGTLGWSPDGTQLVTTPASEVDQARLINLADGSIRRVPRWYAAAWQRLAP